MIFLHQITFQVLERKEKPKYDVNRAAAKISALLSDKIDKYENLIGEEILSSGPS